MAGFKRRTLKELLKVNVNRLTEKSIQGYKKVARDEVNRMRKAWEGRPFASPAYYGLMAATGNTGKISFKRGMTLNEQKKELQKAITFLKDPTRTVKGWEKVKKSNLKKLNKAIKKAIKGKKDPETGKQLKVEFKLGDYDKLFTAYRKAKEIDSAVGYKQFRYLVLAEIADKISDEGIDVDQLAVDIANSVQSVYEEKEAAHQRAEQNRSARFEK